MLICQQESVILSILSIRVFDYTDILTTHQRIKKRPQSAIAIFHRATEYKCKFNILHAVPW